MNWEQTICEIRKRPEFKSLVIEAYLDEDLVANINRFKTSQEFQHTLNYLKKHLGKASKINILDLGAGNGISTIAFALNGYNITALEPDPSATVGAEAIRKSIQHFDLQGNVKVVEAWGESLPFEDDSFHLVYGRQVMHHAHELNTFVSEASRVLKKGGIFMTTRDHVINDEKDKLNFLNRHPLHKFYGGENAFTLKQYTEAFKKADLKIVDQLGPKDSPINYDPWSFEKMKKVLESKIGTLFSVAPLVNLALRIQLTRLSKIPGRLYSFVSIKE